ncbi:MAG: hypothetical protein Q4F41_17580 [Eubacteriales bacterium]|nr:hypothetical protein [Eubacteriales bacterium]
MKNNCMRLVKIQLSGMVKGKEWSAKQMLVVGAYVLVAVMVAAYSFLLAYGFGKAGMISLVPGYGFAITGLITVFFTALKANGVLFAYRDYEMLMALPIRTSVIITSRFLTMYLLNLAFTALVMLPMGIGYGMEAGVSLPAAVIWIAGMLVAPLIPTTIATFIGLAIIWFSSRFRFANAVTTIVSFVLVIGILAGSFGLGQMEDQGQLTAAQMVNLGEVIAEQIHRIYPPSALFDTAVNAGSLWALFLLAAISLVWYGVFLALISWKYRKLNTALMTTHARGNYQVTELRQIRQSSPVRAICKKELKRFFTCPIYTMNMGMGVVMALVVSAACMVLGVEGLERMVGMTGVKELIAWAAPFFVAGILGMTCTTSVSLSLEGKNLWILQSLPLAPEEVYKGKIAMNLVLTVPAAVVCAVFLAVGIRGNAVQSLLLFVVPVAYCGFHAVMGMWINLKLPNYRWTSETAVVKQSMAAFCGIFLPMVNVAVPVGLVVWRTEWGSWIGVGFGVLEVLGMIGVWGRVRKMRF